MREQFRWTSFDLNQVLPTGWVNSITKFALTNKKDKVLRPTSVTSREALDVSTLPVMTVGGAKIYDGLPWLAQLYEGLFRDLGQRCVSEQLFFAKDKRYAINLNIQMGSTMRYEAHVDSNPLEGLLYVTSHRQGDGGELVVGNDFDAKGIREIDADATRIYPQCGTLVFFDARRHPHYVAPLSRADSVRIVVAMNFYTPSSPEEDRPPDLNRHLGIE